MKNASRLSEARHVFYGKPGAPRSHELETFVDEVSAQLQAEYERIRQRAREDPGTAGDEGEENWRELLADWLPGQLSIVTKGRILGADGRLSPQVDVLVLHPGYPPALRNKKTYLAGGVLAAFECKLTLRAEHVGKAAATARTIRSLAQPRVGSPYEELRSPIIFGLLAHGTSLGRDPLRRIDGLLAGELARDAHPREALDMLCVADLMCWQSWYILMGRRFLNLSPDQWEQTRALHGLDEEGSIHASYGRWVAGSAPWPGNDQPPNPLYELIGALMRRMARELPEYQRLADYWLLAQTKGTSGAATASRSWPFSALSDEVAAKVGRGELVSSARWSRWNIGDW